MIAKDFIYCKPETEQEAVGAFSDYENRGKKALYYGGGSEIITMARAGSIAPDAVIDLKAIPACNVLQEQDGQLIIGGAVTLETIRNSGTFPLLGTTVGRIADHTNQCRITLGGNLCGTIIYKEAVLPLLLADAQILAFGPKGRRTASIHDVFDKRMKLNDGEFICQVQIPTQYIQAPFQHIKQTTGEKIDYPAVTIAALSDNQALRFAFSGVCRDPFRSAEIEGALNDNSLETSERIYKAALLLPQAPLADSVGSADFRVHLFKTLLQQILEKQKHEDIQG